MIQLLALFAVLQADYQGRAKTVEDAVAEERLKAAGAMEGLKAWRSARTQYRIVRTISGYQDAAQTKIDNLRTKSTENEALPPTKAAKVLEQLAGIGKLAATKHAELARWCATQQLPSEAKRHWSQALWYDPTNKDAIAALGFAGVGVAAVDPIWKDVRFDVLLAAADGGKADPAPSELATKWRTKTSRQVASKGAVEIEGVEVAPDRMIRIAKIASADLTFWRIALGEPDFVPKWKRLVVLTGEERFHKYIDDFYEAPAKEKEDSKASGGTMIPKRSEFVTYGENNRDASVDYTVAEYYSYFVISEPIPPWLSVAVGCLPQKLLLGKIDSFSFEPASGTDKIGANVIWADDKKFQDAVRGQIVEGKDSDLDQISSTTFNALTQAQIAKSVSLLRFLLLRSPAVFRGLIAAYRQGTAVERADFEKVLGCGLDEFDEHWRRWVLAGK